MGNRSSRIKETRRKLRTMLQEQNAMVSNSELHKLGLGTSRGSSVNASTRQSMLDVSMRSTEDEHSGKFSLISLLPILFYQ